MKNFNRFEESDVLELGAMNTTRMGIIFALDKSGSMNRMNSVGMSAIELLMASINRFRDDICQDEKAAEAVDVAVVAFDNDAKVLQPWVSIKNMNHISCTANGGTNLSDGLSLALDMLQDQAHMYEELYSETKIPWMIVITDGDGGDITDVAARISERVRAHKMKLFILAVEGYNENTAELLLDGYRGTNVRPLYKITEKNGFDFTKIFNFFAISTKAVSTSAPGTRVKALPGIAHIPDLDELLN